MRTASDAAAPPAAADGAADVDLRPRPMPRPLEAARRAAEQRVASETRMHAAPFDPLQFCEIARGGPSAQRLLQPLRHHGLYRCPYAGCSCSFTNRSVLSDHLIEHHTEGGRFAHGRFPEKHQRDDDEPPSEAAPRARARTEAPACADPRLEEQRKGAAARAAAALGDSSGNVAAALARLGGVQRLVVSGGGQWYAPGQVRATLEMLALKLRRLPVLSVEIQAEAAGGDRQCVAKVWLGEELIAEDAGRLPDGAFQDRIKYGGSRSEHRDACMRVLTNAQAVADLREQQRRSAAAASGAAGGAAAGAAPAIEVVDLLDSDSEG
eukprot:TRINITY_DN50863_c0_g1_i1.p1 TRINITY_DN50863_c0_g1~~TRINITY_DN50863_c0_g1_i1.p1  ORF type:complete len:351 (+),score=102.88 TRINITY_DN50863_c0_g1_i1:87-1055(+)